MKQDLKTEFNFSCKCSVCIGDIPHQNLTKEKIKTIQTRMMRQDRGIQNSLKKKLSDWRRDAMEQKKIVDLTKTLYVLQLVSRMNSIQPTRMCLGYLKDSILPFTETTPHD